ncbi:hypothetical protein E4V01_24095 [Methylorubrum sp. Q1]|uniref:hypothetical protein n=1 Tax=Methylorubrum sp. Q1 TaxID=2562453 RepID=UPI001076337F|nr:hypothetical protein [Methylorubrum sp. Q1]TFZ54997.1 hypothetical protein E4V01_24095 [Methylorubrum sp. Q1]
MADNIASFTFTTQEDWYGELVFRSADDGSTLSLAGRQFIMLVTPARSGAQIVEPKIELTMGQDGGLSLKEGDPSTLVFRAPRDATKDLERIEFTADILEVFGSARYLFMPVRINYVEPSGLRAYLSRFLGASVSFAARQQPIVTPVAVAGRQGARGAGILSGSRAPLATDGGVGDFWIDLGSPTQPPRLYPPKTPTGWASSFVELITNQILSDALGRAAMLSSARFSLDDGNLADGQTALTIPGGYTPGIVMMFRNGAVLQTKDYTATDGSRVVLSTAARADDVFDVRGFRVGGVANAAPAQHQHNVADVLGLPKAIEDSAQRAANLGDLADPVAARSNIGLGNVDNTADAAKPVSLAQGMAIAGRVASGAVGNEVITPVGATLARIAREIFADYRTLESFGAVADFTGDPATATDNRIAFNRARASGARVIAGRPGAYYIGADLDVAGDVNECLHGLGVGISKFVFGVNCTRALKSSKSGPRFSTAYRDFDVCTLGQETVIGIDVTYAVEQTAIPRGTYERLRVIGWDRTKHGPKGGLLLRDNLWCVVDDIYVEGRVIPGRSTPENYTPADYAVRFESAASSGCGYIGKIRGYAMKYGIDGYAPGAIEGINVGQIDCVDVLWGARLDFSGFAAGLEFHQGHVNGFLGGVTAKYCPEAHLANLVLYKHPNSPAAMEWVGIALDVCTGSQASNVKISNYTNSTKLKTFSVSRSSGCALAATTSGGDVDVTFDASSTDNHVDLLVQGTPAGVLYTETGASAGKNSVKRKFVPVSAKNAAAVTSSGTTQSIASITTYMRQGERRRVSAALRHISTTASGELLLIVAQTGGTGTVKFYQDADNAQDRRPQSATVQIVSLDASIVCTATGTVRIDAQVLSTVAGGSINAGGCQMTIE